MAIEKRIGAYSAYAISVKNGFTGTEKEWLESLIGPRGYQGWGVSAVSVSADGSLIFTVKNPETGETKDLEPIQIESLNALNSISTAKDEAVNEVKKAQTQATEAVEASENQALQDISDAKTSATGAVNTAGENAVNSVNSAGQTAVENAQTAITTAKNQAVSDVQNAGQSAVGAVGDARTTAVEAVEDAQTNAVQAVENAGTAEIEKINDILPVPTEADAGKVPIAKPDGSGYELGKAGVQIDDTKTAPDTTWSSECIVSRICPPFEMSGKVVTCQPVEGSSLSISCENALSGGMTIWQGGKNMIGGDILSAGSISINNPQMITSNPYGTTISSTNVSEGTVTVTQSKADNPDNPSDYRNGYVYLLLPEILGEGDIVTLSMKIRVVGSLLENVSSLVFMPYSNGTVPSFKINIDHASSEEQSIVFSSVWSIPKDTTLKPGYSIRLSGFSLEILSVQLEWGSKATEYEPYRGKFQSLMLPGTIPALSGTNTIYADSGNITVSGYANPKTIINTLTERIEALEQNAIGG